MSTHLKRKHAISLSSSTTPKSSPVLPPPQPSRLLSDQLRLYEAVAMQSKLSLKSPRALSITNAIASFIAKDMRPYSIIDNEGFKHLVSTLEPRYSMPSRAHFSTKVLPQLAEAVRERVMTNLGLAGSFGLTTDGWTSRSTESYVTVTAHFLDDNFEIQNYILQTRILRESHSGENLSRVLSDAMTEWNLKRELPTAITTDNASNIVSGVSQVEGLNPHIRCFAHTLNIATQKGISVSQVNRILGRVRRIVSFFHKSSSATAVLKGKQDCLDLPNHKLIIDVQTRWNSSYEMVGRYIEQQAAIFATLLSKKVKKNLKDLVTLSDEDNEILEDLVKVLKQIKTVTTILCDTKHPTVSLIHPLKEMLCLNMKAADDDSATIKVLKNAILKDLSPRYTDPAVYKFLLQSSALDPRFKTLPYIDDTKRHEVFWTLEQRASEFDTHKVVVKKEHDDSSTTGADTPTLPQLSGALVTLTEKQSDVIMEPPKKKVCQNDSSSALDNLFGDVFVTHVEAPKSELQRLELEIVSYKSEATIPISSNPLEWWCNKQCVYPILSKMAKYYLSIPATSVASERVFFICRRHC